MRMNRPYIPLGVTQQSRIQPTRLQQFEDDVGTCNTCPGELEPAECLQRDQSPPPYPWRALGAGLGVMFAVVAAVHLFAVFWPAAMQVAAR